VVDLPYPVDDVGGLGDESRPLPFEHRTHGTRVVEDRHAGRDLVDPEPDVAQLTHPARHGQQRGGVRAIARVTVHPGRAQQVVLVVVPEHADAQLGQS